MKRLTTLLALFHVLLLALLGGPLRAATVRLVDGVNTPRTGFALRDLRRVLVAQGLQVADGSADVTIEVTVAAGLPPQGYALRKRGGPVWRVEGGDDLGAMYGLLELAEQVTLRRSLAAVEETSGKPAYGHRGIKMNIALDARLPSYDDTGDAAQKNIREMWNYDFWVRFLDDLARHRYNLLSLWSLHPFPAMVKLADYPGAEMNDVYRYTGPITADLHRTWPGINLRDTGRMEKILTLTIEEKIAFWQRVMQHAHDRGIEVVWFTWNIFITPNDPRYDFRPESDEALRYMQASVEKFLETYPHLSGFGLTAGERMGERVGRYRNTQWLWEAYGKGAVRAMERDPRRSFRFIFRQHQTNLKNIMEDFGSKFPGKVETDYKPSVAHLYSSVRPPLFEQEYLPQVKQYGVGCWMSLRNDDNFNFRWGDPDYVRGYLQNLRQYPVPGYYMGSDGYLWGREFTSKVPSLAGELEITKHWYTYLLWGRLGYDPELGNERFRAILAHQFPRVDSAALFVAWQAASKVFPLVNNFHWQPADSMWSVEGCMSDEGFHTVRHFIDSHTLEQDFLQSVPDHVRMILSGGATKLVTPVEVARRLRQYAAEARTALRQVTAGLDEATDDRLRATLNDIRCLAHYGDYYAGKILGAVHLHLFERGAGPDNSAHRRQAMAALTEAAEAWAKLMVIADGQYRPQLLARTRELDWIATYASVKEDIEIVRRSDGSEPRIAKLFVSGRAPVRDEDREALLQALAARGYRTFDIKAWQAEGHATGYKVRVARKDDLVFAVFTTKGGRLEPGYERARWTIQRLGDSLWVIGEDAAALQMAIGALIAKVRSGAPLD